MTIGEPAAAVLSLDILASSGVLASIRHMRTPETHDISMMDLMYGSSQANERLYWPFCNLSASS